MNIKQFYKDYDLSKLTKEEIIETLIGEKDEIESFDDIELEMGFKEEKEHLKKEGKFGDFIAIQITIDHLKEDSKYYSKMNESEFSTYLSHFLKKSQY